ncbi:MAG: phosphatidylglycerophosphatase A [Kangiellaceae bacterium]|nr:phosphatidylglycerophosphatase A [Kangiellaceae bacterium]
MQKKKLAKIVFSNPIHLLAFGFGSGLLPKAPGTWGTLVAIPIWFYMAMLSVPLYLSLTILLSIIGIAICHYSAKKLGVHDHPGIVWDEICGYLITMAAAPYGIFWALLGFLLFRIFDILKPWPIKWLDKKVDGGFGIMIDDILAGVFTCMILQAASLVF